MLIDNNIKILSKNPLHWIGTPKEDEVAYPVFMASENDDIEYFRDEQNNILKVSDQLDPNFKTNIYKKELIFVIGINSIHEISKIYKQKNAASIMIIIEPRIGFFQHVLANKELSILKNEDILLFVDNIELLPNFLSSFIYNLRFLSLLQNIKFYITNYYRNFDLNITKNCINYIRKNIISTLKTVGNSIEDSLQGLSNNLQNIKWIQKSKNPAYIKNKYVGKPAIIVSAGPSLNKNISQLKNAQGKAIIIAVDTTLKILLKEGIVPDFVCSVERIEKVYEYFYKNVTVPNTVTLVAPPLLDPRIFEEFQGELMLPFRLGVGEYKWLKSIFNVDDDGFIEMGTSCAHVAFGLAMHLGASPIILMGQDLAYGQENQTHALGAYNDSNQNNNDSIENEVTEGYYDETVNTTKTWLQFKIWFETKIIEYGLNVINATEGGAKIYHTTQMPLKDAINKYCTEKINEPYKIIKELKSYNQDTKQIKNAIEKDLNEIKTFKMECTSHLNKLNNLVINEVFLKKNKQKIIQLIEQINYFIIKLFQHQLLAHNLQSMIVKRLWDFNKIEQIAAVENLKKNKELQIQLLLDITSGIEKVEELLESTIVKLSIELDVV